MNSPEMAPAPASPRPRSRLQFELIFASAWLAGGLFVLPALIFMVGTSLLGPYGENGGSLGRFYADFFSDLAEPSGRAWTLAVGPLVLISLVRAVFLGVSRGAPPAEGGTDAPHKKKPEPRREHTRVEPHVGAD
jgi:hypothetical protein